MTDCHQLANHSTKCSRSVEATGNDSGMWLVWIEGIPAYDFCSQKKKGKKKTKKKKKKSKTMVKQREKIYNQPYQNRHLQDEYHQM